MTTTTLTQRMVKDWLITRIAKTLRIASEDVSSHSVFSELGMSSLQAIELAAELENWSGREIPATIVYEYPTIDDVSTYVISQPGTWSPAEPTVVLAERTQPRSVACSAGEVEFGKDHRRPQCRGSSRQGSERPSGGGV